MAESTVFSLIFVSSLFLLWGKIHGSWMCQEIVKAHTCAGLWTALRTPDVCIICSWTKQERMLNIIS